MVKLHMLILLIIALPSATGYVEIEIDVQDVGLGEVAGFEYVFKSAEPQPIVYVPYIHCQDMHSAFPQEQEIIVEGEYNGVYDSFLVTEEYESQICKASIHVMQPYQDVVSEEFMIDVPGRSNRIRSAGTDSISIQKIYHVGDEILLDNGMALSGKIIFPGGMTKDLSGLIRLEEPGTYTLEYLSIVEDSIPLEQTVHFSVISESVDPIDQFEEYEESGTEVDNTRQNIVGRAIENAGARAGIGAIMFIIFIGVISALALEHYRK